MSSTINFGIDLGTTNSAIAKYNEGTVEIFKNPLNLKQTLPSVIAFYRERIIVGDKAREILQKDPENVFGSFKRKMGTSDKYFVASKDEFINAETLSSFVLKELKNFIHTEERIEAAVITIPASFDMMQSNATKKAGYEAGLKQVILLQEPIAASLAFANKTAVDLNGKTWIVYDLGGGTFDVAIVKIDDDEMKVIDHEGNNYLGGTDFDKAIIDKIVIPYLYTVGEFVDLEQSLKNNSGKYNRLYNILMYKAEEVKIQLTNLEEVEFEFEIIDESGKSIDVYFMISRSQFNDVIQDQISSTISMIEKLILRNDLQKSDIDFILMIGGSTYVPSVRKSISNNLNIKANYDIDPTTAVVEGAAFYAGNKIKRIDAAPQKKNTDATSNLQIRTAYSKVSKELDAVFVANTVGLSNGHQYRIVRKDRGFDSGMKELKVDIVEYLTLVPKVFNEFTFTVYDKYNNVIPTDVEAIEIMQGKFSVEGQPLPNDICLEVDMLDQETTFLEPVFKKNTILPQKKTIIKTLSRNIKKDSSDKLIINVLEGPVETLPSANKTIGFIEISGHDLERDLIKNSDVELTFEMSESRDLIVEVYLTLSGQEFENSFSPSETHINLDAISIELEEMRKNLIRRQASAEKSADYRGLSDIQNLLNEIDALDRKFNLLNEDDVTDVKYQLDESKRSLAAKLHKHFSTSLLQRSLEKYYDQKIKTYQKINNSSSQLELMTRYNGIIDSEKDFIRSENLSLLNMKISQLEGIVSAINSQNAKPPAPEEIIFYFHIIKSSDFNDPILAESLIRDGEVAAKQNNTGTLIRIIDNLSMLIVDKNSIEPNDLFRNRSTGLK